MRLLALIACCVLIGTGCQRERRETRPAPTRLAVFGDSGHESDIYPGGTQPSGSALAGTGSNPYEGTAYGISEGQRLFAQFNCTGCHAHGGGGMGPPLIKDQWIYGNEPVNLFDTIVKGRPNGMPTWGGKIPEYQIWQLVAYIRSLNHLEPKSATPPRADTLEQDSKTIFPPKIPQGSGPEKPGPRK